MDRSRVGPFALEERLGDPHSGKVFRAVHIQQRRSYALRFIPAPFLRGNDSAQVAWADEFSRQKEFRHPNVVRCFGGGLLEMEAYLVSELIDGSSVERLIASRGPFPWELVVAYALQISAGLKAIHELEAVHGRLAPDKILLTDDDQVHLCGLLLDQQLEPISPSEGERSLKQTACMAPELFDARPWATPKSDLYALGCVLFEMLSGRPLFDVSTVEQQIHAHRNEPPPRVASIVLDCPVWLDVLVGQLVEKDPNRRPYAAVTVEMALQETRRQVARGTGVAEHAVSGASPLRTSADKQEVRRLLGTSKPRRKRGAAAPFYERPWFLAACLAMLLLAIGGWILWPPNPQAMIRKADRLMETGDRYQWAKARRWYLEPLVERFPDEPAAVRARRHLDTIEMESAERRVRFNRRIGRKPGGEGERRYVEALEFEEAEELAKAIEVYEAMDADLDELGPDRPFMLLARRRRDELTSRLAAGDGGGDVADEEISPAAEPKQRE